MLPEQVDHTAIDSARRTLRAAQMRAALVELARKQPDHADTIATFYSLPDEPLAKLYSILRWRG